MGEATSFIDLLLPLNAPAPPSSAPAILTETVAATELGIDQKEAQRQAEEVLTKARIAGEELLDDARTQAEVLREAAWQEGLYQGKQSAHQQVETTLTAEWQVRCASLHQELQEIIDEIGQARQTLWERQEGEMVAFVLEIAQQVIKTEVRQNEEIVMEIIRNAVRRVTDKENIRIRVSVSDAERVRAAREDLLSVLDGLKNLEIVDDRRVGDGGCVIETNAGTIDAKIETQIAEIERVLINAK